MRDVRFMNMTEGQKIESDTVMKRIGELAYRNLGAMIKSTIFDSGKALIVGEGLRVEPSSLMTLNVPSGAVFQRFADVVPCLQTSDQTVTIDAATGSPRTDIVEAQIKVVADKDDTVQVATVASGAAISIANETIQRDIKYYLSARKQTGTTTPTVATAAILTGTVAIPGTIDLSSEYLLNLADTEDGSYQEIDCRGATPSATSRAEIISAINTATGRTMASTGGGNVIVLTGIDDGETSYFGIKPPATDTDKDCLQIILGVSIGGIYRYEYEGTNEWFKLAEIDVGASTTTITSGLIRNVDEKSTWADGGFILLSDFLTSSNFLNPVTIEDETDSTTKDTGSLITEGGMGIEKNLTVGENIKVDGYSLTGNVVQWTSPQVVGTPFTISSIGSPALAALGSADVAFIDSGGDELRKYHFDGTAWAVVGNPFTLAVDGPALTALNGTDVAFMDSTIEELRTYRFDGSDWSLIGSALSIPGVTFIALAALNGTDVAFIDDSLEELRTYRFNGSNWSQVGNPLPGVGNGLPTLTALNSTDVAFIDSTIEELRTYRFDGTNWSLVGSALSVPGLTYVSLSALNSKDVAFIDANVDELRIYRFDESNWVQVGITFAIASLVDPIMTTLNGTDVAYIDESIEDLTVYRFGFSVSGFPHNPVDPDWT